MMSVMQLMQTSFKTTIYTIINLISTNIASHICQCAVYFRNSAVLDAQNLFCHFHIYCSNNMPACWFRPIRAHAAVVGDKPFL